LGHSGDARDEARSSKGRLRANATGAPSSIRGRSNTRPPDDRSATYAVLDEISRGPDDDAALVGIVTAAQRGDELAFAELYTRLFDRVHRYLVIALKNEHDAQEIAQDVFAKLLVSLRSFDPARGQFRSWLFSVVRRMALDHLRRASRSDSVAPDVIGQYGPRVEERFHALRERFDPTLDLAAIVDSLPRAQHRVIVLRFAFDFTPGEIAEVVGTSVDAVRHTQHRALKAIAARIGREAAAVAA
jgi:RNA polymerase sigma-70 factor (ECF subfamily)